MDTEYNKAQQIKDRITRFSKQDNRVTLKYYGVNLDPKNILVTIKVEFQVVLSAPVDKALKTIWFIITRESRF